MPAALETRQLHAGYGDVPVIRDVSLRLGRGEIVALLGANGAGKTTLLLTLAGALRASQGDILIDGRLDCNDLQTRSRQAGIALVTDDRGLFRDLTTWENLRLARVGAGPVVRLFPQLEGLMNRKAGLLSGGEQQMLAMGRALARKPKILLADEISLGLAPIVVRKLLQAVRAAADAGTSVILVEQQVRLVLEVCDRAYVLQRGRVSLAGTAEELRRNHAEIERSYLSSGEIDVSSSDLQPSEPDDAGSGHQH